MTAHTDGEHSPRRGRESDHLRERKARSPDRFSPDRELDRYDDLEAEPPVTPIGATPRTWRQLLHFAVGQLNPNGEYTDSEYVARFELAHGPYSFVTCQSIAMSYAPGTEQSSSSEEQKRHSDLLFALLMLGVWPEHPMANTARDCLLPYASSADTYERWVSAIGLGHLRDERAIPMLIHMLTEDLPQPEPWDAATEREARARWEQFGDAVAAAEMLMRYQAPHILAYWGLHSVVPALRQTLDLVVRIERTEARWDPTRLWRQNWQAYQNHLLSALARLGAFGAIMGILPLDDDLSGQMQAPGYVPVRDTVPTLETHRAGRLHRWRVTMCKEVVRQQFEETGRHGAVEGKEVRPEIDCLLARLFGLDQEERRAALEQYDDYQLRIELY